jgi:hypothetical protein
MARTVRAQLLSLSACAVVAAVAVPLATAADDRVQVVVTLDAPSLARMVQTSRVLSPAVKARRLDLGSPLSRGYLAGLHAEQAAVERRIRRSIPSATVRWRYSVVLNGLAVALARRDVSRASSRYTPEAATAQRSTAARS